MRFPALLTAKITEARIEQFFRRSRRVIAFADPAEILRGGTERPVSYERIRATISNRAPVIWIGGSEPLDHPGIGHFVRALAHGSQYIFLETNGILLRRRIHEFQPLPRVFLVIRLDVRGTREFDLAVEGLRAARLSGFFTAVHSPVRENSDLAKIGHLRRSVTCLDFDGWMITAESADNGLAASTAEARKLIPSAGWRRFSKQFEHALRAQAGKVSRSVASKERPQAESCKEDMKVA